MQDMLISFAAGRVSGARLQSTRRCIPAGPSARAISAEVAASTPINRKRFSSKYLRKKVVGYF